MTVWLITDGEYSSYHIVTAYSTKAKAEEYIARYKELNPSEIDHHDMRIEELEVDEIDPTDRRTRYHVVIGIKGQPTNVREDDFQELIGEGPLHVSKTKISGVVRADSPEHAIKIVNEKRISYLAEQSTLKGT